MRLHDIPLTNLVRLTSLVLFVGTVSVAVVGWMLGRDPNSLMVVLGAETLAMGVGELSNVGKRATLKPGLSAPPQGDGP